MKPPVRNTKKAPSTRVPAKTQGLLVLGMHRSGTSAVTRVLNLLGCALPDNLIGPSESNETGHWESVAAMQLNDAILASAGSSWLDWGAINEDWRQSGLKAEMLGRIRQVIEDHAALGPLFALKDPRTCRLADLWLAGMADAKVEPRVLLMLRNPAEVCASLEARDLMAAGYGQLLWLRHVLDAEYFSRGVRRIVCRYDQLMRNWPGVVDRIKAGLGIALPRNTPAVQAEIEQFLNSDFRHHERSADAVLGDLGQSAWLRRTFAIMMAWSEQGENKADHAELDKIRHELDQAHATFARLLLRTDTAGAFDTGSQLKRELSEQLAVAKQAAEAARQAVQEAESRRATAVDREAELQTRMEAGDAQTTQLQAEINALRVEAERTALLAAETESLRAREAELVARMEAGGAQTTQLQAEINALRVESERTALLAAETDSLRAREAELVARLYDESARAQQQQAEINALRAEAEETALLGAKVEALRAREAELVARLDDESARTQHLQAEINELQVEAEETALLGAKVEALRAREAELVARLDDQSARAQQQQAEINALRAEAERSALLATEAEALRVHKEQLARDVAQLEAALQAAKTTVEQERQQRLAVDQTLATQIDERHAQELRNAELAGRVTTAESALVQRQEELSQLWSQLLVAEKAAAVAETHARIERDRRQDGDRRLTAAEAGTSELRKQLEELRAAPAPVPDHLIAEIAQLTRLLQQQETATRAATMALSEADAELAGRSNETAQLTRLLLEQKALTQGATAAQEAAERALARQAEENSQLQARLQQQETAASAAGALRAQTEQKLDARFAEIAALTSMLADAGTQTAASSANAEWLRSMMQIAATFPKWWALMPQDWRRKREHARFRSSGLFDAARYLETYPDVADNGMDPVRHYILHGMLEGRIRPN